MSQPMRFLKLSEVVEITSLSRATIWRYVKAGALPQPDKLGPNRVAWRSDEIDAWMKSRSSGRAAA